jgi:hypothetical protein
MFSASDAAFSGFRAGREHFRTLLAWIPILGAISLAMVVAMVVFGGPALMAMQHVTPQTQSDPRATLELLKPLGSLYAVLIPLSLLYYGILYSAVNRLMLRPSDRRMAYFGFGADEFRQVVLMVLTGLFYFAVYLVGVIVIAVVTTIVSTVGGNTVGIAVAILAALALLVVFVVLGVRLSLASAQTFVTGRINIFGSWALTKGHFWPMLGAYLLAAILALIAYAAVYALLMLGTVIIGGGFGAMSAIFSPDMSSLQAYFTPAVVIYQVLAMIPAPFLLLIFFCPAPSIYRSIVGDKRQAEALA